MARGTFAKQKIAKKKLLQMWEIAQVQLVDKTVGVRETHLPRAHEKDGRHMGPPENTK